MPAFHGAASFYAPVGTQISAFAWEWSGGGRTRWSWGSRNSGATLRADHRRLPGERVGWTPVRIESPTPGSPGVPPGTAEPDAERPVRRRLVCACRLRPHVLSGGRCVQDPTTARDRAVGRRAGPGAGAWNRGNAARLGYRRERQHRRSRGRCSRSTAAQLRTARAGCATTPGPSPAPTRLSSSRYPDRAVPRRPSHRTPHLRRRRRQPWPHLVSAPSTRTTPRRRGIEPAVVGGEGWRADQRLQRPVAPTPPQAHAPIVAARYRLCAPDGTNLRGGTARRQRHRGRDRQPAARRQGDNTLEVWLEDEAQPERAPASDLVHLRLDPEAPRLAFLPQDPNDPLTVAVRTNDSLGVPLVGRSRCGGGGGGPGTRSTPVSSREGSPRTSRRRLSRGHYDSVPGPATARATRRPPGHDRRGARRHQFARAYHDGASGGLPAHEDQAPHRAAREAARSCRRVRVLLPEGERQLRRQGRFAG